MEEKAVVENIESFICNGWNITAFSVILAYGILFIYFSKSHRQVSAIPAFCTGIGVFFTFLVLWLKLHDFKMPVESAGSTVYLQELIRELTAAFSTSVIGVIMSLVFTPFVKWKLDRLDAKTIKGLPHLQEDPRFFLYDIIQKQKAAIEENKALKVMLEKKLDVQEKLAEESKSDIKSLTSTTSKSMESVSSSMKTLSGNFKKELTAVFDGLKEQLESQLDTLASEAVEKTQKTTETINNTFTKKTTELLGGNLKSIETALSTNNNHLEETITELREFVGTVKNQFNETQASATSQINEVQKGIEITSNTINGHLEEQATKLGATIATINTTMFDLNEKIQGATQKLLDENLTKLTKAFTNIENLQKSSHTKLEQTTKEFAEAVNEYKDFTSNNQTIIDKVQAQIEANEKLTDKSVAVAARWEQLSIDVEAMQNRIADINHVIIKLDAVNNKVQIDGQGLIN